MGKAQPQAVIIPASRAARGQTTPTTPAATLHHTGGVLGTLGGPGRTGTPQTPAPCCLAYLPALLRQHPWDQPVPAWAAECTVNQPGSPSLQGRSSGHDLGQRVAEELPAAIWKTLPCSRPQEKEKARSLEPEGTEQTALGPYSCYLASDSPGVWRKRLHSTAASGTTPAHNPGIVFSPRTVHVEGWGILCPPAWVSWMQNCPG